MWKVATKLLICGCVTHPRFRCGNSNRGFIRNRISRRGERTERWMLERIGVYRRGEIPGMQRGPHLLHHAHHVAPTSCDLHTDGHPPTRDAAVERTRIPFPSKVHTNGICSAHIARGPRETANRGQLQFISWCGRVRGFQTTRYTGLSWPISAVFCPRLTRHNSITFDSLLTHPVKYQNKKQNMFAQ